jgi:hypothetical protein
MIDGRIRHPLDGGGSPRHPDYESGEEVASDIALIIAGLKNGDLELHVPFLLARKWNLKGPFWDFILGRKNG